MTDARHVNVAEALRREMGHHPLRASFCAWVVTATA